MPRQLKATSVLLERCIATWRQTKAVRIWWSVQCLKNWQRNTKLTVERVVFFLQTRQQAEALKLIQNDMQCKGAGREGLGERVMKEDFKLTPLWIFPNTVYYNTVSLNTVCLWKWNQDKSVTEKRNPKEVTLSFGHLLCEETAGSKG